MKIITDLTCSSRSLRPRSPLPAPALRLDFRQDLYHPAGFDSLVSFSRAGAASYYDASGHHQTAAANAARFDHLPLTGERRGLLIEGSRTNLLIGSAAPATRSVTVMAGWYALSFEGTGSITLSGAHVATLSGGTGRSQLLFQPTSGTLTLTISGAVANAQLESGNCTTSYIATSTAPGTRAADIATLPLGAWWSATEGTIFAEWQNINQATGNTRILSLAVAQTLLHLSGSAGENNAVRIGAWNGSQELSMVLTGDVTKGRQRGAIAWSTAGRSLAAQGVSTTSAGPIFTGTAPTTIGLGSQIGGSLAINGCLLQVTFWPMRLTDAQLRDLTA